MTSSVMMRQFGTEVSSTASIELSMKPGEHQATLLPRLGRVLFERGIASNLGKVYVSLAYSDADLDDTIRAYAEALGQVKRDLPR